MILSLATPVRRLRQVMGTVVQVKPRTMALRGISTVRLKCGAMRGCTPVDNGLAVSLEGVGCIVQGGGVRKKKRMKRLASRLKKYFNGRIIDGAPAPPLMKRLPKTQSQPSLSFFQYTNRVARTSSDSSAIIMVTGASPCIWREGRSVWPGRSRGPRVFCTGRRVATSSLRRVRILPCPVGRSVVDDDDFMGHVVQFEFEVEMANGRFDAAFPRLWPG